MAQRIILNEISYHGFGAINHIPEEVKKNKFKKALICTDKGLLEFGGVSKITDLLDKENLAYEVLKSTNLQVLTTLSQLVEVHQWILQKQLPLLSTIQNFLM